MRNSSTNVATTTMPMASGRRAVIESRRSTISAGSPPTWHRERRVEVAHRADHGLGGPTVGLALGVRPRPRSTAGAGARPRRRRPRPRRASPRSCDRATRRPGVVGSTSASDLDRLGRDGAGSARRSPRRPGGSRTTRGSALTPSVVEPGVQERRGQQHQADADDHDDGHRPPHGRGGRGGRTRRGRTPARRGDSRCPAQASSAGRRVTRREHVVEHDADAAEAERADRGVSNTSRPTSATATVAAENTTVRPAVAIVRSSARRARRGRRRAPRGTG